MSAQTKEPARDGLTDLAAKIYMELICRNVVVTESAAQIKSNPENLARISFKLAEAFQRDRSRRERRQALPRTRISTSTTSICPTGTPPRSERTLAHLRSSFSNASSPST